ncbi:MAG TPA: hypothetical protein PLB14_08240 [Smithellaceae bacterium]|jgi:hypothetical protein|nr:hypothetical protein [Syntrophaceae bacterium]HPL97249.1 hypothetical protein [Smithellaceae bacterium]HPV49682.1 hypothetical protein [Smithellaceae bacterium]
MIFDEKKQALELTRRWLENDTTNEGTIRHPPSGIAVPRHKRAARFLAMLLVLISAGVLCAIFFIDRDNVVKSSSSEYRKVRHREAPRSEGRPAHSVLASGAANWEAIQSLEETAPASLEQYPSGWPEELFYPDSFTLMEADIVGIHDHNLPAYAAVLRYEGTVLSAAEDLRAHLRAKGWQIADWDDLDSGAMLITVSTNDGRGSGEITVDLYPGQAGKVRIVAIMHI